jgi:DNA-binding MarR family transcriptional regulator
MHTKSGVLQHGILETQKVNMDQQAGETVLSKADIGFDVRVTWLAVARMFGPLAVEHGITVSMGFALLNISREKGTPATKIAPLLGMEPRSLTRMIKKLEEEGLVLRRPDPEDKRSVRIFLTALGAEKKAIALQQVQQFNEKVRLSVKPKELQTFFEVLEKIHFVIKDNTNGKA